jgi:hypothetical protein
MRTLPRNEDSQSRDEIPKPAHIFLIIEASNNGKQKNSLSRA